MTIVTILGLGEAGALYAAGLSTAGATVYGFDPYVASSACAKQFDDVESAVADADVVISLVGASAATAVASAALPHLNARAVYADFNTASPQLKAQMATEASTHGIAFADIAVLAPVPRAGSRTPLLASGSGAIIFHDRTQALGIPTETVDAPAGAAANHKLVRSVFMKGLAGVVTESIAAGKATGCEQWIRDQITSELGPDAPTLVERLLSGSRAHAQRRQHEAADAAEYLRSVGVPTWMTDGAHEWLASMALENQRTNGGKAQ